MSNDPKPQRPPIVTIVFKVPVLIYGNAGSIDWIAGRDAKTSTTSSSVDVDYVRRMVSITHEAGAMSAYIETPLDNVASIVRIAGKK